LSLVQLKTYNFLILQAQKQAKEIKGCNENFFTNIKELKLFAGIKATSNINLKESIQKLQTTIIEFNILNKDNNNCWSSIPLLSGVNILNDGVIEYDFSWNIKESLLNPNIFSILDMAIIKQFTSKYSIILYEFIEDYKKVFIPELTVEKFRELLGLKDNQYKDFGILRLKIIERSISEISQKTNLNISYEVKKRGRKVTHIKFRVEKKKVDHLNQIEPKSETLAQFIVRVKKEYRGKAFVKPRYVGLESYLKTTTFIISKDTGLVINGVNNSVVDSEKVKLMFKNLYENQKYLGQVKIRLGDFIGRTIELKTSHNSVLGTVEEFINRYEIINIIEDKTADNRFKLKLKSLENGKIGSSQTSLTEKDFIKKLQDLVV
jgi:plasmid replication initiation protein